MTGELYQQIQEETKQNTKDINTLTRTVDRLALIQENSEKLREEDRKLLRELAKNAESLDRKISDALQVVNDVNKLKEDYRAMSHDIRNFENVQIGLTTKVDELVKSDATSNADIKNLKEWHDREREKDLLEAGGEKLKQKTWKTLTTIGGICMTIGGGVVWLFSFLFK